jgi:predicted AlkP superfamily pyrophosphatase or phosphodiesterase
MLGNVKPFFYVLLALSLAVVVFVSFGSGSWRNQPTGSPVLLVGVDGIEWDLALPLIAAGRMPTFERLMAAGRYGNLETLVPTHSPVIWTSVATGVKKETHNILGFADRRRPNRVTLYDNRNRLAAALWNILTEYDKRVMVIGWWMTWPVEPVNGVMVAQTNTMEQLDTTAGKAVWKGALRAGMPGQVYPPELEAEVMSTLADVETELPSLTEEIFGRFPNPLSRLGHRLWTNCQWAFRADTTYARVAGRLLESEEPFDLSMVYFGGSDVVAHRFYRYMKPELYENPPTDEQVANFGEVIRRYYCWLDGEIEELIGRCPDNVTVILVSDHGMVPVNRDVRFDPDDPPANINSAHHYEGPPGIFVAAGPWIDPAPHAPAPASLTPQDLPTVGSIYDIAPTILALLRVPCGRDMVGRPLGELFAERFHIRYQPGMVSSHTTKAFLYSRRTLGQDMTPERHQAEQERIEQLRSLGYLAPAAEEKDRGASRPAAP